MECRAAESYLVQIGQPFSPDGRIGGNRCYRRNGSVGGGGGGGGSSSGAGSGRRRTGRRRLRLHIGNGETVLRATAGAGQQTRVRFGAAVGLFARH